MPFNPYEEKARLDKVIALLACVPYGSTPGDTQRYADALAGFDTDFREAFAWDAGLRKRNPKTGRLVSDECWVLFVSAARCRKTTDEALAMVAARMEAR